MPPPATCVASADYKVPDEYSGDDIKWHRAGRPFGCVTRDTPRIARFSCMPRLMLTFRRLLVRVRSVHTRSLRFPDSCDMSKIDAKFNNGSAFECFARRRAWIVMRIMQKCFVVCSTLMLYRSASAPGLCVKLTKKPEAKTHRIQIGGLQQAQQIEAGVGQQ